MKFKVSPMTCGSCVITITKLLQKADASATVRVDLLQGTVEIDGGMSAGQAESIIRGAGYEVEAMVAGEAPAASAGQAACRGSCHS